MGTGKTVFIVEDDLISAKILREILQKGGYEILAVVDNAEEAIRKYKTNKADILLMDIMLKGRLSGSEAAIEIRHYHPECKIIFLTAFADPEMIEYAAEAKAYAYLMKPYREKEILATIKMALSQEELPKQEKETNLIELKHGFLFDKAERRLYKNGQEIPLSSKKIKLVELLAKNKNCTVSNEQICMHVWNEIKSNSTLRSLIHRFRSAIDDDIVDNVNGAGYCIHA
jgi:DNA-binding response OmpR family regulator